MHALHDALRETLTQILAELQRMQLVLEREALALKDRNAEILEQSAQEKQALTYTLDALSQRHAEILRMRDLPAGKEGIERLLSALPPSAPAALNLVTIWQDVQFATARCRKLNEANGAYIALLRQHVQRSLDVIHGQPSQDFVYGPDGVGRRPMSSRKLLSV